MTTGNRMMHAALGSWIRLAPFAGLRPDTFEAEELWRRDNPGQARIVLRMRGPRGQNVVFKRIFAPAAKDPWVAGLNGQRRAVRALAGDPMHAPPAVLAEDAATLSTIQDFVPGRTLQDHMLLKFDQVGPRASLLAKTGAFLAAYQTATFEGEKSFNPAHMRDFISGLGQRALAGDVTLADPDLFAVLAEGLDAAAHAAAGQTVPVAAQHGDLHARNLILSPNRTTLVDFSQDKTAPVQYDMARLIVDLGARFSGDAAPEAEFGIPPVDLAALSEGYGRDLGADACLAFLCRCRVLQDWASLPAEASKRSAYQQERLLQLQRTATHLAAA